MKKKANTVTLECEGKSREFDVNQAERILRMPKNGGWKLPDDSKYQLDKNNGLITKQNTRAVSEAKEKSDNK